ncbi:hypothetical protein SAMN05421786_11553 [Chryseobacterium ureilyticum]|uniref:Uncharacterized protein n=1 Tax=Chryseobacterium ureilyticum TaxID=373668 RepID=A0A1N7QS15_9FLAO|nr:hypothetical protein [Chryseobacterium ureilyticum]SIT25673.1 hypothetical protein SAMN05421786_11553 [Chryseobacterium ureilyticum]
MWFNFNAQEHILQTWPSILRLPKISSFLSLISEEIIDVNNLFLVNRNQNITKIRNNSQTCFLRKILNDTFDYQRRIKIVDTVLKQPKYIYTEAEKKPKFLGEMIVYTEEETEGFEVDFTVLIPGELRNYQIEIKSMIDFFKLASKRYKIVVDENI